LGSLQGEELNGGSTDSFGAACYDDIFFAEGGVDCVLGCHIRCWDDVGVDDVLHAFGFELGAEKEDLLYGKGVRD
jgi:fructose-1,6-bisphosphatase/inositol monophosphatase family enzyme